MANGIDTIAGIATNVSNINTNITTGAVSNLQTTDLATITGTLQPLIITTAAIVIYSLFVFKFYRFLAERDILKLKLKKKADAHEGFLKHFFKTFLYLLEHVIMVPVLVFFWFAVLAAALLFLSKNTPGKVMLLAMAIVAGVRITAYYSDELSKDLAKMIPFALLGVVIVDQSYISLVTVKESIKQLPLFLDKAFFYLLFVVAIELIMRIALMVKQAVTQPQNKEALITKEEER